MNILQKIVERKKKEIGIKKQFVPVTQLERSVLFERPSLSMTKSILNSENGIIAEHKRRSPSKDVINNSLDVIEVAKGYEKAGVAAMSVLTDNPFFGGSLEDLLMVRATVKLPLLRKEFIIDPYQIIESKAHGADAILLIAAILDESEINEFSELAKKLDLDVLCEVHDESELNKVLVPTIDMIGVNNRNLKDFSVSIETSKVLSDRIPNEFVKVSESGISSSEVMHELKRFGYRGFLMGEHFMRSDNPGKFAEEFIKEMKP